MVGPLGNIPGLLGSSRSPTQGFILSFSWVELVTLNSILIWTVNANQLIELCLLLLFVCLFVCLGGGGGVGRGPTSAEVGPRPTRGGEGAVAELEEV